MDITPKFNDFVSNFLETLDEDTEQVPRIKRVVRDMFLIEFYERLTRDIEILLLSGPTSSVCNFYERTKEISYLKSPKRLNVKYRTNYNKQIYSSISKEFPSIISILNLGKGKISLCGASMVLRGIVEYFQFYFDSCTILEANDLLNKSIQILGKDFEYWLEGNSLYFFDYHECIGSFCLNIYNNKQEMLMNVGPMPDRHGWNPFTKYFTTLSALVTVDIQAYPFDINFKHLDLYRFNSLGLSILFHGFDKFNYGDKILTTDGIIFYGYELDTKIIVKGPDDIQKTKFTFDELTTSLPSMKLYKYTYKRTPKPNSWLIDYIPYQVGIDDDRYVALSGIRQKFNLDNTIFRVLCFYWLEAEVFIVKQRLIKEHL